MLDQGCNVRLKEWSMASFEEQTLISFPFRLISVSFTLGFLIWGTILASAALQDVMGFCSCGHHVRAARTDFDAVCEVLLFYNGGGIAGGLMSYTLARILKWTVDNGWWSIPPIEHNRKFLLNVERS